MTAGVTNYGNVAVITLREDLAGDAVDAFRQRVSTCLAQQRAELVLDCSGLTGLDSTALEALVELQNKCEERLGAMKLCALDPTCRKILEITRLMKRFENFDDLDSAVKSFS